MNIKLEFGVLVFLSMLFFLDFAVGSRPQKPRFMKPPFHRSNGASRYTKPRRMPFGPMFQPNPQIYGNPRTPPRAINKPYKRSQFPSFGSLFAQVPPLQFLDSGPKSMSVDDAFKTGYEIGKTVAISDSVRNQGRPMYGLEGGSKYSPGTTVYSIFFPSKPSNNDYFPDPGFGGSVDEDEEFYDQTGDVGNDVYPPTFPYSDIGNSVFGPDFNLEDIFPSQPLADNFVATFGAVSVPADSEDLTPVVLDTSSGTVLVPVENIDTSSSDSSVPPLSSNK